MQTPEHIIDGPAVVASGLVHRVLPPDGDGPHPTVVMVHGRSGNEDVMWIFARTLPKEWLLVAPRAHYVDPRGGFSWDIDSFDDHLPLANFDAAVASLVRFIQALPDLYGADLDNLYLMGFSQGAATCAATAIKYADIARGLAILVGFLPNDARDSADLSNLRDLPIHMAVGREDDTIPLHLAEQSAQTLVQAGARLDYRAYDTGHKMNARGLRDLAAWWERQAK